MACLCSHDNLPTSQIYFLPDDTFLARIPGVTFIKMKPGKHGQRTNIPRLPGPFSGAQNPSITLAEATYCVSSPNPGPEGRPPDAWGPLSASY